VADNRVIGREGRLPWSLPADLARFRTLTMGHVVIMGRKTSESLGRDLPGRRLVVLSRDPRYRPHGTVVVGSFDEAISLASDEQTVFVAGGARVYELAMATAWRLYLTRVWAEVEGDVFFPEIDGSAWAVVKREDRPADASWSTSDDPEA